jgi:hypothetical protein
MGIAMDLPQLCVEMVAEELAAGRDVQLDVARDAASLACVGGALTTTLSRAVFWLLDPVHVQDEPPEPIAASHLRKEDLVQEASDRYLPTDGTKADLARRIDKDNRQVWARRSHVSMKRRAEMLAETYVRRGKKEQDDLCSAIDVPFKLRVQTTDLPIVRSHGFFEGRPLFSERDLVIAASRRHGSRVIIEFLRGQQEKQAFLNRLGGIDRVVEVNGGARAALVRLRGKITIAAQRVLQNLGEREHRVSLVLSELHSPEDFSEAYPECVAYVQRGVGSPWEVASVIEDKRFLEANPDLPREREEGISEYVRRCGSIRAALPGLPPKVAARMAQQETQRLAATQVAQALSAAVRDVCNHPELTLALSAAGRTRTVIDLDPGQVACMVSREKNHPKSQTYTIASVTLT